MTRLTPKWRDPKIHPVLLDFLERAGWSAGQVFLATLLGGGAAGSVGNLPWRYALTLAVSAAVASVLLTSAQYAGKLTDLPFWPDLLVRLGKTFVSSLSASIVASGVFDITRFSWSAAFNIAFIATIGGLGKGLLAREHVIPVATAGPSTVAEPAAAPEPTAPAPAAPPAVPTDLAVVVEVPQPSPSTLPTETYRAAVG